MHMYVAYDLFCFPAIILSKTKRTSSSFLQYYTGKFWYKFEKIDPKTSALLISVILHNVSLVQEEHGVPYLSDIYQKKAIDTNPQQQLNFFRMPYWNIGGPDTRSHVQICFAIVAIIDCHKTT